MKKRQLIATLIAWFPILLTAYWFSGCSTFQTQFDTGFKNITAAQCANQPATLANLPLAFVTPAQAAQILATVCQALYPTVATPTLAPGMSSPVK